MPPVDGRANADRHPTKRVDANQRHLEETRVALAYARKHACRLSKEFQFAQREGREPNLPLIRKEARRLARTLTHPQEIPTDE